jgi:YidC/Oxa1 family membrane protein insertase
MDLFKTVFYKPIFNFLILIYQTLPFHDLGLAIIFLTIIIKAILYPISVKATKSQKALREIQPKVLEIQKKYKNKEEQTKELMEVYKKVGAGSFLGAFLSLIQLPILIAIYRVFYKIAQLKEINELYSFVPSPKEISPLFLGMVNLGKPNTFFAFLVLFLQFFQLKNLIKKQNSLEKKEGNISLQLQKQMLYFSPLFVFLIALYVPSAISLYLIIFSICTIIEQNFIRKESV